MSTPSGDAPDEEIDPETLAGVIRRGESVAVLDVRDRDAFETWHVDGPAVDAVQIAYNRLLAAKAKDDLEALLIDTFGYRPQHRLTVTCAEGRASAEVAAALREIGVDAVNLAGGMAAWADVYEAMAIRNYDGPGELLQYHRPATGCLAYLLVESMEAAIVDPLRVMTDRYVDDASNAGARMTVAADTHVHGDHLSGIRALAERTGATPTLPAGASDRGLTFDGHLVTPGPIPAGNEAFTVGAVTVRSLAVPGHTPELSAFLLGNVLLTGDSLLLRSVARPDLLDGSADRAGTLYESLQTLLDTLPEETVVAPGHVAPSDLAAGGTFTTDVGTLKRELALLDLDREAFVQATTSDTPERPANHERIVATNLGHETADADAARTLELGPNKCAATGG